MRTLFAIILLVLMLCFSLRAFSESTVYSIGTTGYMIREAMQAKANRFDKANYLEALKLQKQAKAYVKGTRKCPRNLAKAQELTKQAYGLAKAARDVALKARNIPVAY